MIFAALPEASACKRVSMLPVVLSIDVGDLRQNELANPVDRAVHQCFPDSMPYYDVRFVCLISVRSEVQLLPGPFSPVVASVSAVVLLFVLRLIRSFGAAER